MAKKGFFSRFKRSENYRGSAVLWEFVERKDEMMTQN